MTLPAVACVALAGAFGFVNTFDAADGGAAMAGNATTSTALAHDNATGLADTLIVNGSLCVVTITHASVGNSPVCTIVDGDNSTGVVQSSHVEASCDGACNATTPPPADDDGDADEPPAADPAGSDAPTHVNTSYENHTYVNHTYENHTHVNESSEDGSAEPAASNETCTENSENVCDVDEESTEQDCSQSNEGALVNVQVCNVNVEPVDDVTVNDAVDVVRGDVDVEDNDVTVAAPADADATLL